MNMAPSVSIFLLVVAWAICIFMHFPNIVIPAGFVAASESLELELETKALLDSGWWSDHSKDTLSRCKWHGITCNVQGSVIDIQMAQSHLRNEISKFNFYCFPNLVSLNLFNNGLRGSIPLEIVNLSKLTFLDLSKNYLTGELPLSLKNLTQLEKFYISQNLISGSIPDELGNLKNLLSFELFNNKLTGSIPSSLGLLKNLQLLDLSFNEINGSILEIVMLRNLTELYLDSNQISGYIPGFPQKKAT